MSSAVINDLYRRTLDGDKSAENELFEFLTARFRLFARHRIWIQADAEEIVQETLMVILGEYKSLVIDTSFTAWAYKVLDNRILAYIKNRSRDRDRTAKMDDLPEKTAAIENPGANDLKRRLVTCLRKICVANTRYARILNLHYQGYVTDEICTRLGITQTNFYSILSRARSLLDFCLDKGEIE